MSRERISPKPSLIVQDIAADPMVQRVLIDHYRRKIMDAFMSEDMEGHKGAIKRMRELIGEKKERRGRPPGPRPDLRKHSAETVKQIRDLYHKGVRCKEISRRLNISNGGSILEIAMGRTYKDVD